MGNYGDFTEEFTLRAAAAGGQPDFVYRPVDAPKGQAQREIGDCIIWVGMHALIVSVKSRDPDKMGSDTEARAKAWLDKQIGKALRQIEGTVRTLKGTSAQGVQLQNMRGINIPWRHQSGLKYFGVVVVNYTPPPGYRANASVASVPGAVLQIHDWEFLNAELWSSSRLVEYVETRSRLPRIPMEGERDLFGHVVEAEQAGHDIALPGGQPMPGKWEEVVARWPEVDARNHPDARDAYVIDAIMRAMGEEDLLYTSMAQRSDYLELVRLLDQIPVLERVQMGSDFIERTKRAAGGSRVSAIGWPTHGKLGMQIVFVADSASREDRAAALQVQAHTRHAELFALTGSESLVTLGIATEPWPLAGGSHDFVVLRGDPGLSAAEIADRETVYAAPEFPAEVIASVKKDGATP
jgi:hypothetical protein